MEPPQREFIVELPIGYTDEDGLVQRQAVLRKMRGHEEALLYDAALNPSQLVTELLVVCLVRLGDLEPVPAEVVTQLYVPDRNFLLLELRRITLGDGLRASYICLRCESAITVIENLSRLPVHRLADGQSLQDIDVTLDDGYVDRRGVLHRELSLAVPRGVDEAFVAAMAASDLFQAQDALTLRCITRFGTLPKAELEAYGVKILQDLTLGDRQRLQSAFNDQLPGIDFRRTVDCPQCGETFDGVLDVTYFFELC